MAAPPGSSHRGRRLRTWALPALAIALVFASAITQVTSSDTWVHLSLGRWMFENGRIPRTNLLSYTEPDRPVVDHQWLFQAGLFGLWKLVGLDGATVVKAAIVAAAFGLVLATARQKGAGLVTASLVTLVAAGAARFRFTLRPDVVGMVLLVVYLYLLERWRHGKTRGVFLLLPLQVAWANLHGSSVLGWGLALAYALAETLRALGARWKPGGFLPTPRPRRELGLLWGVAVALVPLTLANPFGTRILELPFGLAEAHAASGLKELHEERAHLMWAELGDRHLLFTILAGVGFLSLLRVAKTRDLTELGIFICFLEIAVRSGRFVGFFAVATAPIVAWNLWALAGARLGRWADGTQTRQRRIVLGVAAAASLVAIAWLGVDRSREELPPGFGIAGGFFPESETDLMALSRMRGELAGIPNEGYLLNEFEHGGYIYWRTRRPVFLDSRGLLAYDAKLMQDYVAAWTSPEKLKELIDRYQITAALVARPPLKATFEALGWRRVCEDQFSVYAKPSSGRGD